MEHPCPDLRFHQFRGDSDRFMIPNERGWTRFHEPLYGTILALDRRSASSAGTALWR